MAKQRAQKQAELDALRENFAKSKGVVFARYKGLSVNDIQELRQRLRKEQSEMLVSKKTLMGLMLAEANLPKEAMTEMDGPVAVVFGYQDEVAPAKVLAEFAKDHEAVGFYAGVLDGKLINEHAVLELSKLPSKAELLAKLVGSIKSPVSGFVNVLNGNLRGLAQVLNQIKEKKEQAA
jgi:large subunit ribosomal protein L10